MTPTEPARPPPPAVAAFLRGLRARAWLLARVQAGADLPARQAMGVVDLVFATEAGLWPIARWPAEYWRLLLATPGLQQPATAAAFPPLPGIARLPAQQRAAVLLLLVANLDEAAAAAALGVSVAACQELVRASLPLDALGKPDVDVWRAWRAAVERTLEEPDVQVPHPSPEHATPAGAPIADRPEHETSLRVLRWLWFGVAVCAIALGASLFLHPKGRAVLERLREPIKLEALPPASAPKARFDPGDAGLHPDRERLAAPREAAYADDLAMLAWLVHASANVRAADAVRLPLAPVAVPGLAPVAADDAAALSRRIRQWDALSPTQRGVRRGNWQAWRALAAEERVQLRAVAQRFRAMSADGRQDLRLRFDAQSPDQRTGWWIGPRLGRDWPRVAALFAYVDAGERTALLKLLRESGADDIDALERLAQGTPPEARAELRRELLAMPPTYRTAWLQERVLR